MFGACLVVVIGGCGSTGYESSPPRSVGENYSSTSELVFDAASVDVDSDGDGFRDTTLFETDLPSIRLSAVHQAEAAGEALIPVAAETPNAIAGRKIIYTATVGVVVKDLADFLDVLRESIANQGGFVGASSETGMDGSNPSATLTIRVPSVGYSSLLDAIDRMGTVEQRSENSQDVTAQFVDLDARIRNKQREETRLLELLDEARGKLTDILEVEKELTRVRGEIERAQGQMNVLGDQIDLATIVVNASERTVYTPPQQALFGDRVGAAWTNSLKNLSDFGTRACIEVVAFFPWLVIWIPLGIIAWFVVRRVRRELSSRTNVQAT